MCFGSSNGSKRYRKITFGAPKAQNLLSDKALGPPGAPKLVKLKLFELQRFHNLQVLGPPEAPNLTKIKLWELQRLQTGRKLSFGAPDAPNVCSKHVFYRKCLKPMVLLCLGNYGNDLYGF